VTLECIRFVAHADDVPLLGVLRTSAVIGAPLALGGYPLLLTDRPRPSFRQHPAKGAAFQRTRMPFTVTNAKESLCREGIAPSGLRAGSLAHAAHTLSPLRGQCLLIGHCKVTVRSPAPSATGSEEHESADTFLTPRNFRAWD
jgi:hypothetical protein